MTADAETLPALTSTWTSGLSPSAYSHEVISFGFWAGDRTNPFPAYYSYTAPEPTGLTTQPIRPEGAAWAPRPSGSLAVLPYADVRSAADPKQTLLEFPERIRSGGFTGRMEPGRHRHVVVSRPLRPAHPTQPAGRQ
jgi:hypothetical protein